MPETEVEEVVEKPETTTKEEKETNPPLPEKKTDTETDGDQPEYESLEDGRIALHVGESTYYGKTKAEAWKAMTKGIEEKDKSYAERVRELNELKAKRSIREPEEDELRDEPLEQPAKPDEQTILEEAFKSQGLKPEMAYWRAAQWRAHKEANNLDELDIQEQKEAVQTAITRYRASLTKAQDRYQEESLVFLNRSKLREDITPEVRAMVAESGLEAEEFGEFYLNLLRNKDYKDARGLLNGEKIVRAIHAEILKRVKAEKKTTLVKTAEEQRKELEERKKNLGKGGGSGQEKKIEKKQPQSIEEATRMAMAEIRR